jgi:formiminoglutamase
MLEAAQERLGSAVSAAIDAGHLPVVFGGGHEVAYGTYRGVADSQRRTRQQRLGVLNLDAHFDLRIAERPSSGTPFRQALLRERDRGMPMSYDVLGISQPSNTSALFDTAAEFGVRHLLDEHCGPTHRAAVDEFLDAVFEDVDLLYLTIDLDVLPAAVAPGVSAPAAFGVPLETIQHVCDRVAASGLLVAVDVAELNPVFDVDGRTARTAARLVHRIVTTPAAGS